MEIPRSTIEKIDTLKRVVDNLVENVSHLNDSLVSMMEHRDKLDEIAFLFEQWGPTVLDSERDGE